MISVNYLQPDDTRTYASLKNQFGFFEPDLQIYCFRGQSKSIAAIFQSLRFRINIDNDDFVQFEGESPEEVKTHYDNQRTIFSFNVMNVGKKKLIKIDPFNQTCVGIESAHKYTVTLNVVRIDIGKIIMLGVGLFLFFYARTLSQTPLFYYLTGIFIGIFASFLVLVYFASKLIPKVSYFTMWCKFICILWRNQCFYFEIKWIDIFVQKPAMYGILVGGWTVGIYFIQMIIENLHTILFVYQTYVFWYVIATGFISFIICYRLGPPKNQRSKDLIKWSLQFGANIMIFYSSNYREASVAIMILTISIYYFPLSFIRKIRGFWLVTSLTSNFTALFTSFFNKRFVNVFLRLRKFPPKKRLLTSEEFHAQSVFETTKALEELKAYCSSPASKPWRMMTRLKDPQRWVTSICDSSCDI